MVRRAALGGMLGVTLSAVTLFGSAVASAHPLARARASTHAASGVLIPTRAGTPLPMHGGTADSINWAGYAVTPGSGITGVASTFRVPSIVSDLPPGFSSNWTGIGGYTGSDLIQAGTSEQTLPTTSLLGPQFYAWYEILPADETQLTGCTGDANCTVTPGETISVTITNTGTNEWAISMTDAGHWSWSKTVSYDSSESSAEWIEEAPEIVTYTIPANTGTAYFGPTNTYTTSSGTHTIAAGDPTLIDESPIGIINEATTSPLADGQAFNVCAYEQSCPAP